jgi:hypothetical protein
MTALPHTAMGAPDPARPVVTSKAALVIGNARYEAVRPLKNPTNDAQDMCQAMATLGYKTSCYYDVKTRAQLRSLIEDFVESLPDNAVSVIYYAGHAVQVQGENYLIPTGARLQSDAAIVNESVDLSYLMRQLRRTQDYLNFIILDACRDSPVPSGVTSLAPGLAQVTSLPNGTVVMYATAANETALDGDGRNGILTRNILVHIRDPGTIDELFGAVSSGVQKEALTLGRSQHPALYKNFDGAYCLVECTKLEILQAQKLQTDQQVMELKALVTVGDQQERMKLDAAIVNQKKLEEKIKKEEEETREKQRSSTVPPAF